MIQNKYDAVICDLGNVLVNFDHRIAVKKILAYTPKKEEDIHSLFFDSPLTGLYEEGKVSTDEFFRRVKEALELDRDYDGFLPIWNDIFFETPINRKMHDFLRGIKKKYKLVMVSNINASHFEFLREKMDIFRGFDKLILSYEIGFRKPAPEIYQAAVDSVGTVYSKVFYIDDRRDLVDSAARLGIKGIVFDGEPALKKIREELSCQDI